MKRRLGSLMVAPVLALTLGLAIAPSVSAAAPVEISVTPTSQTAVCVFLAGATWHINLDGGASGKFTLVVNYGDGFGPVTTQHTATYNSAAFNRSYDFACLPPPFNHLYQHWVASRGGGGSDNQDTNVWIW